MKIIGIENEAHKFIVDNGGSVIVDIIFQPCS